MNDEMSRSSFSNGAMKVIRWCNSFMLPGSSKPSCLPFIVDGNEVGSIRTYFLKHLLMYTNVFTLVQDKSSHFCPQEVHLNTFNSIEERNEKLAEVLEDLRVKDVLLPLKGWRNETYDIRVKFSEQPLCKIERAAAGLFGIINYGTHINGYTYDEKGDILMWIGRRAKNKSTFPNMLDNMCAGGLSTGLEVLECAKKECQEEASVSDELLENLKPVNCISYCYEDERGVFPECQFCFDLELPRSFIPVNADGEVSNFELLSIEQIKKHISSGDFKPNCALVIIDFMIRHSIITPSNEPNYAYFIEMMHVPLQTMFSKHKEEKLT